MSDATAEAALLAPPATPEVIAAAVVELIAKHVDAFLRKSDPGGNARCHQRQPAADQTVSAAINRLTDLEPRLVVLEVKQRLFAHEMQMRDPNVYDDLFDSGTAINNKSKD